MKCYKYLLIVSLILGFEVQANQEITNESNKDGAWRTCVNNKDPYDCEEIDIKQIVNIELEAMDTGIPGIKYHYTNEIIFCPFEYYLTPGKKCQKIIKAYEEGQVYEKENTGNTEWNDDYPLQTIN